ncbi:ABC transporter permease [Chelativorans multitrophicus]|uniref:ABC transporter permease n=1 Tax=Chelativorans multitrophicus TaxID=449973 RepID=UPI00140B9265|nr:ABC transporter permease [Chelativorans multitrophicus]
MLRLSRSPGLFLCVGLLSVCLAGALFAPFLANDPLMTTPANRLMPPGPDAWFGTDHLGRDIFARSLYGARVSLSVGFAVAMLAVGIGLTLGVLAGYWRWLDRLLMRVMDGVMAIPSILLAIALVALHEPGLGIMVIAIAIPEIPRVARLARAVILSVRELPYVEAATASGIRTPRVLLRYIMPSTYAPLMVQGTYIVASAIIIESSLSFLGAGLPPEVPTWGNMIASSRLYISTAPWTVFVPGSFLAVVIYSINLIGDALRDHLDVRMAGPG